MRWVVPLFVVILLAVPAASAQAPAEAQLDSWVEPPSVTVSVNETRWVHLHLEARLLCDPNFDGPRDMQAYPTRHGWSPDGPVYWRIEPTRLPSIPWSDQGEGEWVIEEVFTFEVYATHPAPEHIAGQETITMMINPVSSSPNLFMGLPDCSLHGYRWDGQSNGLHIRIPVGVEEQASGEEAPQDVRQVTPSAVLVVLFLMLTGLVVLATHRRRQR